MDVTLDLFKVGLVSFERELLGRLLEFIDHLLFELVQDLVDLLFYIFVKAVGAFLYFGVKFLEKRKVVFLGASQLFEAVFHVLDVLFKLYVHMGHFFKLGIQLANFRHDMIVYLFLHR